MLRTFYAVRMLQPASSSQQARFTKLMYDIHGDVINIRLST